MTETWGEARNRLENGPPSCWWCREACRATYRTRDHKALLCERPKGHGGRHGVRRTRGCVHVNGARAHASSSCDVRSPAGEACEKRRGHRGPHRAAWTSPPYHLLPHKSHLDQVCDVRPAEVTSTRSGDDDGT